MNTNSNANVDMIAIRPFRWEVNPGEMREIKRGERITMKRSEARYHATQAKVATPAEAEAYFKANPQPHSSNQNQNSGKNSR